MSGRDFTSARHNRLRVLGATLIILGTILSALFIYSISYDLFDPRRYWIPTRIPGYEVVAVVSDKNTLCTNSGERRLILRPVQSKGFMDELDGMVWSVRKLMPFNVFTYEIVV